MKVDRWERKWVAAIALLVFFLGCIGSAIAAPSTSFSDLVGTLSTDRDACAAKAVSANRTFETATFKESLTVQTEHLKAQEDAQVYAVGHGSRQTNEYFVSRLQQDSAAQAARSKAISDQLTADRQDLQDCLAAAQEHGKAAFGSFKADAKHKRQLPDAESVMTAWLVNVGEISTDQPQGGDISKNNWSTAKAHAELQ